MFDLVRKHTKILMGLMFLLIIPAFVLVGIDGYGQLDDKGAVVARVGGQEITQGEWDGAHRNEVDRLRASAPNIDVKLLDSPEARAATLERLVRDRVLGQAAGKFNFMTSDARLAHDLQQDPTIASLRKPDGKLDMDRYRQLVASQGLTPEGFEARVRYDLSVRQVESGVVDTGFSAAGVADASLNAFFERREVQIANFLAADFKSRVKPTDAELESFYKANQALFQAPEQASIEYIVLDLESVKKSISLSDADLKSYYDQNAIRLSGKEERRASHILINAGKDLSAADREKARARAQEILQTVRKIPESFAETAKKNSQDSGSAANGGDLDFFARGAMVKPFEDAAFAMKTGEISDLVESDFGFHVIKLTGVKTPAQRSFEELRTDIEADLKKQQAQRKFAETAEAFTNGVYEQSDSLKPVADKLKIDIQVATNVTRKSDSGAAGVLGNAKFLAAIFAPESIDKKRNTEAIETAPSQLSAGRIVQYTPARTLAFNDVKSIVHERVVTTKAAELAKQEGTSKLAAWKASPSTATMPAAITVSRDQSSDILPAVMTAALRTNGATLPGFVGVDLGAQGFAVVRVNKIQARPAPAQAVAVQERAQYAQMWTKAENQAYYDLLKERFKVQILTTAANRE